jgi:hypothetical protein
MNRNIYYCLVVFPQPFTVDKPKMPNSSLRRQKIKTRNNNKPPQDFEKEKFGEEMKNFVNR